MTEIAPVSVSLWAFQEFLLFKVGEGNHPYENKTWVIHEASFFEVHIWMLKACCFTDWHIAFVVFPSGLCLMRLVFWWQCRTSSQHSSLHGRLDPSWNMSVNLPIDALTLSFAVFRGKHKRINRTSFLFALSELRWIYEPQSHHSPARWTPTLTFSVVYPGSTVPAVQALNVRLGGAWPKIDVWTAAVFRPGWNIIRSCLLSLALHTYQSLSVCLCVGSSSNCACVMGPEPSQWKWQLEDTSLLPSVFYFFIFYFPLRRFFTLL